MQINLFHLYLKHIPNIIKPLGKDLIFNIDNNQKKIYLTFDDGPHPIYTPWVLKQLKAYNAKATFFLIGNNIESNPEIIEQIKQDGHSIGNHTFDHVNGWITSNEEYFSNIDQCQKLTRTKLFRPPYGKITRSQSKELKKRGFEIIMYSDLSADFDASYNPSQCFEFASKRIKSGSIIVFHDSQKAWPRLTEILPKLLRHYNEKGFEMSSIEEQ